MFILLVISLASFAYLTLKWFRTYSKLRKIQIPDHKLTKFPYFIDMIYSMIKLGITSPENRFTILANICFQHPDIVKTWLGPKMVIFACNPQRIQKVLLSQKCAEKWKLFYSFMDRETGLISARVSLKWKEHRKFFNSCFSLPSIESFVPMFAECCDDCCESLEQIEQRKDFDFLPLAKQLSFSLLCATSLDMKTKDVFEGTNFQEIFEAFEITEAALNYKLEIPYVYPKTIYKLTKLYRSEKKAQALLTVFRTNIMKKRREFMKTVEYNNNEIKNPERIILTDHIIRSEDKFTTKEIDDHFLTFMGGYETVSNAVAHVILLLAMHTEAQDKLYQAIAKAIPSDGDLNNSVIVNGIEYLECVLRESYRLMPTVPIILREVTDDFEIEPNLVIPKGVHIFINIYALHRQVSVWGSDAGEFKPERFSSENEDSRHIFSFLPFSGGSRICIANKYSNIAIKIAIIKMLKKFKFTTTMKMQDIRLKSYVSLKLCSEHRISLEKREK